MNKQLKARGQNKKLKKKVVLSSIMAAVLAAAAVGAWFFIQYRSDQKTVEVLPVSYCAVTDYWGDQASSSGTILSDYTQELQPVTDKIITDIFVTQGQEVRIGDPLLQYDKTKLELDVEQKELNVKKGELSVEDAQAQLKKLQNTKPVSTSKPIVTPRPTQRPVVTPTPTPSSSPSATPVPPADVTVYSRLDLDASPYSGSGTTEDPYVFLCTDGCVMTKGFLLHLLGLEEEPVIGGDGQVIESPLPSPFAAVFEVREGNSNYGEVRSSFKLDGTKFSGTIKSLGPVEITDMEDIERVLLDATPTPDPNNYNDRGYTAAELKKLIAEKQTEIRDLQYKLKQAKLDLEIAQRALENSTVLSNVDGRVRSLIELDTALAEGKPFMVVAGDDKFYISGALSEGLLGSVRVGDYINAMCWMNGMTYTAQIVSISEFPMEGSDNYYRGNGNPNSSNYGFTAVIEGLDDTLENGMGVEITMNVQAEGDSQALYLDKPYLRQDDAGFYVMKAGKDNRLHKQYVQTGKSIYGGGYLEIKAGLTVEDFVAFPYGADTKEGVRVLLQDSEEPPYPEGADQEDAEGGVTPDGLLAALEQGAAVGATGRGTGGLDGEPGGLADANLPEGAVITGRDENGTYFETENGGGIILD